MRRTARLLVIMMALAAGCARQGGAPVPLPDRPPPAAATGDPASSPAAAIGQPASSPQQSTPPASPEPAVPAARFAGEDLELTGMDSVRSVVWSPSGRTAAILARTGAYLLDTAVPSVTPLPGFAPADAPAFWSESELLWIQNGLLQVRDLTSGKDRRLHDFGSDVIHLLRPGDTRYVASRPQGEPRSGYRFGPVITGVLGDPGETVLLKTGYLVGRMQGGQVLAVAGNTPGGPLWSITPDGVKHLVSEAPAHFAQISPDGRQALWLTAAAPSAAPFDPAGPYDPPLTDLWTWDGGGSPARIPLGGTFSARADFSPDGTRIALALNQEFIGPKMGARPGLLAVVEGGQIRPLGSFEGWVGLGMWLGDDGFRFMPPVPEKTGGQAPIMRVDLTGRQEQFTRLQWYQAGTWDGEGSPGFHSLIMNWTGDLTTVHWPDSGQSARVSFNPNSHLGDPLYVPPTAPYLPFAGSDRLWLARLHRIAGE